MCICVCVHVCVCVCLMRENGSLSAELCESYSTSMCGCVLSISLFALCPYRISGSGECVTTKFWTDTQCPLGTSGVDCLQTSMLHMKGKMGNLSSLKVKIIIEQNV